ncbi:MAG: methionyl-tRNA formyltransferase [Acidimicrobiales bacterium]
MSHVVFCGTPAAAVPTLEALVEAGHDVRLVVTRADTRRGRGGRFSPSPVKEAALARGIEVTDDLEQMADADADLAVVVAYGRIVPVHLLDVVPMLNVHFSLLPRWRGAAPVERAILAGDEQTGVCVMRLEEGLDTGPVLARDAVAVADKHAGELTAELAALGAGLLVDVMSGGVEGLGPGESQHGEPTYAKKLEPDEFRIRWDRPAEQVQRLVRLDRAFTEIDGTRLRVLQARVCTGELPDGEPGTLRDTLVVCGTGAIELLKVQPEGRRPMDAGSWCRGMHVVPGTKLGSAADAR